MSALILQVFENNEIRMIEKEGEFWWVAADVCKAIEIKNVSDAVGRLEEDEKGIVTSDTLGGEQDLLCVSEPGLYSLIFSSRKASAKRFKRWVLHEVLPSIRKTGSYSIAPIAPPAPVRQLAPQRDLKDWIECMQIMGLTEDPILKSLVSQRMAEQIGGIAEPTIALPKILTVRAHELGISQSEIGTGSQLGKYIVAMGFEPIGKSQHGKYEVNTYEPSQTLDNAILGYFDRLPVAVLGGVS
jgi:hypothetical protein